MSFSSHFQGKKKYIVIIFYYAESVLTWGGCLSRAGADGARGTGADGGRGTGADGGGTGASSSESPSVKLGL